MRKNKKTDCVATIVRMPKNLYLQCKEYRYLHGKPASMNSVIVNAIEEYFSPESSFQTEAAIAKRFDRQDRYLKLLLKQIEIVTEMGALFIRGYLTTSPELPDDQKAAAAAQASRRWMTFMKILSGKISGGDTLLKDLQEDKIFTPEDFEQNIGEIKGANKKYEAK